MGSGKRSRRLQKKGSGTQTDNDIPMENLDRRVMEKSTWIMHKFLDKERFETVEDANKFTKKNIRFK